ncbi:MAG: DUF1015 domain-containing protein [Flavobacteriales bacterium]|nr:MAG: DUF1015 domain-containing protein [Flavobacteriales bacterium]
MIEIRPFRAWRPVPEQAHRVCSRSYVTYAPDELEQRLQANPFSFLHVIRPDDAVTRALPRTERFHRVRMAFKAFCDRGVMVREERPALYLYEQEARGNTSRGLICGVSTRAYRDGRIKVHEQTLTARENLFAEYLGATGINAEPVLLASPDGTAWEALLDPVLATRPAYSFRTNDQVSHRLWPLTDEQLRRRLQKAFAGIPALYIADGHHRLASSTRLSEERGCTDADPADWCLAYIVPRKQLYIYNFDRAVGDLGGHDEAAFLHALSRAGRLERVSGPFAAHGVIGVRTVGGWHALHLPPADPTLPTADRLDAARLSACVLGPVLGITDLRTDQRVRFTPGTMGTAELDRMVRTGEAAAAFHLYPVSFEELKAVADEGGTMPPKSTYIEPKLRSGMLVYSLEEA